MRTIVFAIALGLLATGIVAAPAAQAEPDPRPMDCEVQWQEVWSPDLGYIRYPTGVKCYP